MQVILFGWKEKTCWYCGSPLAERRWIKSRCPYCDAILNDEV